MSRTPPSLPIRIAVLLVAVAALFLTMCAHSRAPRQAPATTPDAGATARPEFFPATKAPGPLVPAQQR